MVHVISEIALITPDLRTGFGVERQHLITRRRNKHHPIVDDGRRLVAFELPGRIAPHWHQPLDIASIDFIERTVADAVVAATNLQPVVRFRFQ